MNVISVEKIFPVGTPNGDIFVGLKSLANDFFTANIDTKVPDNIGETHRYVLIRELKKELITVTMSVWSLEKCFVNKPDVDFEVLNTVPSSLAFTMRLFTNKGILQ